MSDSEAGTYQWSGPPRSFSSPRKVNRAGKETEVRLIFRGDTLSLTQDEAALWENDLTPLSQSAAADEGSHEGEEPENGEPAGETPERGNEDPEQDEGQGEEDEGEKDEEEDPRPEYTPKLAPEDYLNRFPTGQYAEEARALIAWRERNPEHEEEQG